MAAECAVLVSLSDCASAPEHRLAVNSSGTRAEHRTEKNREMPVTFATERSWKGECGGGFDLGVDSKENIFIQKTLSEAESKNRSGTLISSNTKISCQFVSNNH